MFLNEIFPHRLSDERHGKCRILRHSINQALYSRAIYRTMRKLTNSAAQHQIGAMLKSHLSDNKEAVESCGTASARRYTPEPSIGRY